MMTFEVKDDDDIILFIAHMHDGSWVKNIQPMRCPQHSEGAGLNISGKQKDDGSGAFAVSAFIEGCCQEFIDFVIDENRKL